MSSFTWPVSERTSCRPSSSALRKSARATSAASGPERSPMASDIIQVEKPSSSKSTSGRKLKAMLLFPPEWVPTAPYLALPSLTAGLRPHGPGGREKDGNNQMDDYFFSDPFLI